MFVRQKIKRIKNRKILIFFLSGIIFLWVIIKLFSSNNCLTSNTRRRVINNIFVLENYNDTEILRKNRMFKGNLPECILEDVDPWDPVIEKFLKPNRNKDPCNVTQQGKYTELENRTLFLLKNDAKCKYRCGYPLMNGKVEKDKVCFRTPFFYIPDICLFDSWKELSYDTRVKIDCDFVETRCFRNEDAIYAYVHTQARPKPGMNYAIEDENNPSVFIMIYDATSAATGARALLETQQVLKFNYEAQNFHFFNKVGINSRPNAVAMYTGTRIQPVYKGYYNDEELPPEIENSCSKPLVRNDTLIFHFADQNYATMMVEDHIYSIAYPDCWPFSEVPVEHYGEPLFLLSTGDRAESHGDFFERLSYEYIQFEKQKILDEAKLFKKTFYDAECEDRHDKMMRYVQQFLDQNPTAAKFTHVWNTIIGHNDLNVLQKWDNMIADFFKKNKKKLENSFIFIMADHGLRFGAIRQTPIGRYEDNNPMLIVAVPKFLRKNKQLMRNVFENSRRHTSTYDFYATLYDIMHLGKENKYKNWDFIDFRQHVGEIRGSRAMSLFRPITKDRHCIEMDIPDNFCICKETWLPRNSNSTILMEAGQHVIAHINNFLESREISRGLCEKLIFDGIIKIEEHSPKLRKPAFRIVVRAKPSNGTYETIVRLEEDGTTWDVVSMVDRINSYNKQGDCTWDEETRPLCYCKKQKLDAKSILGS